MSTEAAHAILSDLQRAVAAKDRTALHAMLTDDVVLFGTSSANLDVSATHSYLERVLAADGVVRWDFEQVVGLVETEDLVVFAAVGTVGLDDPDGAKIGERAAFRLTAVGVRRGGGWRLRHFHGSVPEGD